MTDNHHAMEWSDSFLLGFTPMDDVHEEFVNLIGRMQAAEDAALPDLFDALAMHLKHHFELEDRWMVETDFPPRDCHIEEHAAVLQSVREVHELLRAGNTAICRDLVNELANWFPSHADHLDSALAHWMSKLRFGGKPVVLRRGLSLD
ncbi:hemerythrin-like metal-binding protein [Burkholderia sp. lig30]|jgi:hemerythrin-like metal-binding protein|uniref:bacteriohemerythrin n=1 Tax=Burkholderia sp. lig30 TaxID=1192124 RepID=UPI00046104FF|nr:hemerythrin domain-containing protein [Burkholderia sp. lig30]KDB08179.1 hemerythrin-like metal-binding protein [Burkholderia sp. lig30]